MKNKILFFIFTLLLFHMASGNGPTTELNKKKIQKMEEVEPPRSIKTEEEQGREKKKKYEERKMRWLMEHEAHYPHDL